MPDERVSLYGWGLAAECMASRLMTHGNAMQNFKAHELYPQFPRIIANVPIDMYATDCIVCDLNRRIHCVDVAHVTKLT